MIVGGGYAGCLAANRLARKAPQAAITLINPRPQFVERVRLHQLLVGTGDPETALTAMVPDSVDVVMATATAIEDGRVRLENDRTIEFDHLIYAAGGAAEGPAGTLAVGSVDQAHTARRRLAALGAGAVVMVVGGGATGIETAAEIAAARPDLSVVLRSEGEVGAALSARPRRRVRRELIRLGVRIERGRYYGPDASDSADLVLWAIATEVADLARRSGLAVDDTGRLRVDADLVSTSDPRILGAGDGAAVPGQRLSCQTALPQGAHAADNLARRLSGAEPKPYSMGYTGQNLSLGRHSGVIQLARRDDTAVRLSFGRRPAALVKEQVCRGAKTAARTGRYLWLPGPR